MAEAVITKAVSPAAIFLVNIFIPLYYDLYPAPMCILYYFFCLISSKKLRHSECRGGVFRTFGRNYLLPVVL